MRIGMAASAFVCGAFMVLASDVAQASPAGLHLGTPDLRSMSALAFGPGVVLFIGDGKGGAVFAIDVADSTPGSEGKEIQIADIEAKIAARLGTTPDEIMIHDMAVHPVSHHIYLAVSRGRSGWNSPWLLPNDVADASILLRVSDTGEITEVPLQNVLFARAPLSNPVDPTREHSWKKGVRLRADTITDMAFAEGTLFVAGLSNEEFSSTLWRLTYPFDGSSSATGLEVFHGAHGKYETHAPIRTFVPYRLNGQEHILAAYLCTPLVTFPVSELQNGRQIRGRTVGEFGWGNYPLDMVVYEKDGAQRLLIANSNLPFMIVNPEDVASYEGSITEEVKTYVSGVPMELRSGTGIQQLDVLDATQLVALRRLAGGSLELVTMSMERF